MNAPLILLSLTAGALWGLLALLLGARAFGPSIWGGVLSSPFIGLLVAATIHARFADARGWRRALWALASVYLGAVAFGLAVGLAELILRGTARPAMAVLVESVTAVLWGVTLTGYWLFLWPLAYATHWLLEWRLGS